MIKTIYKYPIQIAESQNIKIPEPAEIIKVGLDPQGAACIWAIVNPSPDTPKVDVPLRIVGTGQPAPTYPFEHLESFVQGAFVWHVFTVLQ